MTIRSASNTHMVVLVGANGISVAESVLNFLKYRTNFWKKLIIIELCGSSAPTEQDLKRTTFPQGAILLTCAPLMQVMQLTVALYKALAVVAVVVARNVPAMLLELLYYSQHPCDC
jgi:hypothetical protein